MKVFFFIFAFIWSLTSIGSIFLGPFVGLDRNKLKNDLKQYWRLESVSNYSKFIRRVALVFSWAGFLFPAIFPLPALLVALLFVLLT